MTVTWTSGYSQSVAKPIVLWKSEDDTTWTTTAAVTLTFSKADMCGTCSSPSFINIYLARVDVHFFIFLHFLSFVLSFGFCAFFFPSIGEQVHPQALLDSETQDSHILASSRT